MGWQDKFAAAATTAALTMTTGCMAPSESDAVDLESHESDQIGSVEQAITGGNRVTINAPPFSSVVKWTLTGSGTDRCGAIKIGTRTFLTAAHCFGFATPVSIDITNELSGTFGAVVTARRAISHPSFEWDNAGYDVGILELFEETPNIPVFAGGFLADYVGGGRQLLSIGYGCDADSTNDGMKQAGAPITLSLQDYQALSPFPVEAELLDYTHKLVQNGKPQMCPGDSGGPVLAQNAARTWQIVGVMSAFAQTFTYSARTGNVRNWIASPGSNLFSNGSGGFFINGKANKCIGVNGASTANGATAHQFYCDGRLQDADHQFWRLQSNGADHFLIVNGNSGRCLGVNGGSTANGATVAQFTCDGRLGAADNQSWRFQQNVSGFFFIVNGKSGRCLGVSGGSTANGAALGQFTCDGRAGANDNQSWVFSR